MPDVGIDIDVHGIEQFVVLRRRLRDATKDMRLEFLRGIRRALEPLKADIRKSALVRLPRRGGLAGIIGSSRITSRTLASSVRVAMVAPHDLRALDLGTVRHPVWGHAKVWVTQPVTPGFWSIPIQELTPEIRSALEQVMNDIAHKIADGNK